MIRVESVRIVDTNKNYKDLFHALFLLDLIVSDGNLEEDEFEITDLDIKIINELFINKNMSSLDEYIKMTLKSFIKNKNEITINMSGYPTNQRLTGFIIEDKVEEIEIEDIDYDNIEFKDNLISSKIFDIFPYVTTININHGFPGLRPKYMFNLFMFLEIISKSDIWKIIKIRENVYAEDKNTSWLYLYYNKCESSLESEYEKHGLTINFEAIEDDHGGFNEYLIICRL